VRPRKIMKNLKHYISFLVLATAFAVSAAAQTNLTSLDGTKVDVEAQNGKVVVMAIGAAWLPLSAKQAEYTNALAKKYAGKNVVVYFVLTDSANSKSNNYTSPEDIKRFVATSKLTVTVLRDPDGAATLKKFKVDQVPSFVLLNKQGDLAGEPFGGIDPKYDITIPIAKAVDRLL
jgi:peroxiredoxin